MSTHIYTCIAYIDIDIYVPQYLCVSRRHILCITEYFNTHNQHHNPKLPLISTPSSLSLDPHSLAPTQKCPSRSPFPPLPPQTALHHRGGCAGINAQVL